MRYLVSGRTDRDIKLLVKEMQKYGFEDIITVKPSDVYSTCQKFPGEAVTLVMGDFSTLKNDGKDEYDQLLRFVEDPANMDRISLCTSFDIDDEAELEDVCEELIENCQIAQNIACIIQMLILAGMMDQDQNGNIQVTDSEDNACTMTIEQAAFTAASSPGLFYDFVAPWLSCISIGMKNPGNICNYIGQNKETLNILDSSGPGTWQRSDRPLGKGLNLF